MSNLEFGTSRETNEPAPAIDYKDIVNGAGLRPEGLADVLKDDLKKAVDFVSSVFGTPTISDTQTNVPATGSPTDLHKESVNNMESHHEAKTAILPVSQDVISCVPEDFSRKPDNQTNMSSRDLQGQSGINGSTLAGKMLVQHQFN